MSITNSLLRRMQSAALAALAAAALPAWAQTGDVKQDIDIFAGGATANGRPNVILMIDNSANWGAQLANKVVCPVSGVLNNNEDKTKMGAEKCALHMVFSALAASNLANRFNVSMMMFNQPRQGAPTSVNSSAPIVAFQLINPTSAVAFQSKIVGLDPNENNSSQTPPAGTGFYEAWLYLNSMNVYRGNRMNAPPLDLNAFNASRTQYIGPASGSCGNNHIIYLANGAPGFELNDFGSAPLNSLNVKSVPPDAGTQFVNNALATDNKIMTDEMAAWAWNQGIRIHTVTVVGASSDKLPEYPDYFNYVALKGSGIAKTADANDLQGVVDAIVEVFQQIDAVDTVFAAASLPVNSNTQGAYLNQVFIGMFRPDEKTYPRWVGNLKQYKFTLSNNTLALADKDGVDAIAKDNSGFIDKAAASYWTTASTFWTAEDQYRFFLNPLAPRYKVSDLPDGPLVEKGAAAQWLRNAYASGTSARPVYTCKGACNQAVSACPSSGPCTGPGSIDLTVNPFDTSTITAADLGVADGPARDLVVNWLRGDNNQSTIPLSRTPGMEQLLAPPNISGTTLQTGTGGVRPTIHGDVLHSRPVAVNYDKINPNYGVVVFYGANDGFFRAINGNQTKDLTAGKTYAPGAELWAFAAQDHYTTFKRLRDNDPTVMFPISTDSAAKERDYYFDGPIGLYQTNSKVILLASMRRGGRGVYAFDVTTPDAPKLLWRIQGGGDCASNAYCNLGQTWSTAKPISVYDWENVNTSDLKLTPQRVVLIMGGGYDNVAEDLQPPVANTMGKGVYVIDFLTGRKIAELATDYSVPADVAVIDSDSDTAIDRAYVADIRAQVYRIDIEGAIGTGQIRAPSSWTITKIANLANTAPAATDPTQVRKAFFAPDVVVTSQFTAVLLGTGDREKPQDLTALVGGAAPLLPGAPGGGVVSPIANVDGTFSNVTPQSVDRFYVIRDNWKSKGAPVSPLEDPTSTTSPKATYTLPITDSMLEYINNPAGNPTVKTEGHGCFLQLTDRGERVVNAPVTFAGQTFFSTTVPSPANTCKLSQPRAYALPLFCRSATAQNLQGEGLPPSPVVGYVTIQIGTDSSGNPITQNVPFVLGAPNKTGSPLSPTIPSVSIGGTRRKTYWYMENRDR